MPNVLVVDDSLFARRSLKVILNQAGFNVVAEACNGLEALSKYKEFKPDVVTMDITMPLKSGIDAVKSIMDIDPDAKIIMVTALDQKAIVFDALQSGAKHYIIKPFDYQKIISVFEKVLYDDNYSKTPHHEKKVFYKNRNQYHIPLSIETRNNFICVNLPSNLDNNNFYELKRSISMLFIVKPLRLVFNCGDVETWEDSVINQIIELLNRINNMEGRVVFFSRSEKFIKLLAAKNIPALISHYSDTLELSKIEI